jgi:hypothetical protein
MEKKEEGSTWSHYYRPLSLAFSTKMRIARFQVGSMVAQARNLSTGEADAEDQGVQGQPGLHRETFFLSLPPKTPQQQNKIHVEVVGVMD